ncbi:endonuclease-reverse transcriptase [Elysia marginata]|uniref:Endonuclease-reverse transcriptase n=1 Tax=Elysia marginata TaxID=1093978 RepID=A0AAV4H8M1_9GAST|nr:endonuclease-reverse transcriptase [Elysia marginata]
MENAIGPLVDLLTIVRQRKLKFYDHTTRSSGLNKVTMQDTVNGDRKIGRPKKRWEDNIRELTGLELINTLRKADDREKWKAVVKRSSTGTRRIPNLKDM